MISTWDFIKSLGIHYYSINDEKLLHGDNACKIYSKVPCIVEEDLESLRDDFVCNEHGCNNKFNSLLELETHQRARHTHVCMTCRMIFPSFHLLDRHIVETHDAFFKISSQKSPMFACLLESCSEVFATPLERKEHCISVHKFPHDFRYDLQWRKIKIPKQNKGSRNNNKSKKDENKKSTECQSRISEEKMEISCPENKPKISNNRTNASHTKRKPRVPKTISFGMGVPKGFITKSEYKHWHQKNKPDGTSTHIEQISMSDMTEALEDMES